MHNKIRNIKPHGFTGKEKRSSIQGANIALNHRMGLRKCNDLRDPIVRDDERFDLQEFIKFMREVKAHTSFTIHYNESERDSVEVTLQDSRKVYGRKFTTKRIMVDNCYQMTLYTIL